LKKEGEENIPSGRNRRELDLAGAPTGYPELELYSRIVALYKREKGSSSLVLWPCILEKKRAAAYVLDLLRTEDSSECLTMADQTSVWS